jgi:hypothetical protein
MQSVSNVEQFLVEGNFLGTRLDRVTHEIALMGEFKSKIGSHHLAHLHDKAACTTIVPYQ